jgi:SSS family solute:Na+ symporter
MSSLASLFNSSAMLFTIDFYQKFRPEASQRHLVYVGRVATVVIVILGILWIPIMKNIGDVLYAYLQDVQSVLAPGIAAAFLLGVLWKRASAKGGMWGLLSGMIIGLTRLGAKVYYTAQAGQGNDVREWAAANGVDNAFFKLFYDVNWLFFSGGMLIVCMAVVAVVSMMTEAPDKDKIRGLVFGTETEEQRAETRNSWNNWDLLWTGLILAFTVVFYWYFW